MFARHKVVLNDFFCLHECYNYANVQVGLKAFVAGLRLIECRFVFVNYTLYFWLHYILCQRTIHKPFFI